MFFERFSGQICLCCIHSKAIPTAIRGNFAEWQILPLADSSVVIWIILSQNAPQFSRPIFWFWLFVAFLQFLVHAKNRPILPEWFLFVDARNTLSVVDPNPF